jgi:hypothetical protein
MKQLRATLTLSICVLCALPLAAQMERPRSGGILYGPTTITAPGFYYATGDIKGPIMIAADDVHVDLGGFSLISAIPEPCYNSICFEPIEAIVAESVENVTIENGTIPIGDPAIDLRNVSGFTIRGMTVGTHSQMQIDGSIGVFAENVVRSMWPRSEEPPDERQGTRWILIEADYVSVRNNSFPGFYDGGGMFIIGASNSVTDNQMEFAPYCYGGCFGVLGDYNLVARNRIHYGGDSGTGFFVGGQFNRILDNEIVGGGGEVAGGAVSVSGSSNIIEDNLVDVYLSWHIPFVVRGAHNYLQDNTARNSYPYFYAECPSDPGNRVFCDYGEDTVYGGGNYLPDPR